MARTTGLVFLPSDGRTLPARRGNRGSTIWSRVPVVKFLRTEWKVARWGVVEQTPMFKFYVFAEPFEEALKTA